MSKDELQDFLDEANTYLRKNEVETFFDNKGGDTFVKYVNLRNDVLLAFNAVANANLQDIANKLSQHDAELEKGIGSLKEKIKNLEKTVAVLNSISNVVGIVARVIAFA